MPTALQYCQMILPVLKKCSKKLTDCRYSYFLSHKSFYAPPAETPTFECLKFPTKAKIQKSTKAAPQTKHELHKWWVDNLRSVSQKTPWQRSEKDNPGTMPIAAYTKVAPVAENEIVESILNSSELKEPTHKDSTKEPLTSSDHSAEARPMITLRKFSSGTICDHS